MRTIKFKVPVYAIQKLPGEDEKRVCIGIFPIRGYWDDVVVIQMDEIIPELDKHFPGCEYHGEGTFKDSEGCCNIHLEGCESSNEWDDFEFFMNQVELLQYIGLNDKNKKEIYHGDIVDFGGSIHQIEFDRGCFYMAQYEGSDAVPWILDIKYNEMSEIIGNIYENPELLTKHTING